jgi:hypothetical protein
LAQSQVKLLKHWYHLLKNMTSFWGCLTSISTKPPSCFQRLDMCCNAKGESRHDFQQQPYLRIVQNSSRSFLKYSHSRNQ